MDNLKYDHILKVFLILIVFQNMVLNKLFAQDSTSSEGYSSSINITVIKNNDDSRTFTSKLTGEGNNGTFPIYKADILYYNEENGQKNFIGKVKTDPDGIAVLTVGKEAKYQKDKEGIITIMAVFTGSEQVKGSEALIRFKDMNLKLDLEEKDSVRSITISANSIGTDGELIPLKETTVNVYVQGLFTKLKVGDCFIDNGLGSFNFPDNIPGDENGNTRIFVRVEENENFGDVEKSDMAKWGQHRSGYTEPTRSLWSTGAPLWMIITLTILLVGVWSHYLYAIVQLVKIRKEGKILDQNYKNQ